MGSSTKTYSLDALCHNITDGKHGDCEGQDDSGYYFLSAKDVFDGKLNYESARQITRNDFDDTHKRTRLEPSDVVFTNSGTIGRMALVRSDEITQRTTFQKSVAILKPNRSLVEPQFFYYLLAHEKIRLSSFAGGTAQANLLLRDLRTFEVQVPDKSVQRRIADVLSAYDDLIENNTKRIRILEEMARSLYRDWFVEFRFPGHEKVKLVDSELGKIPEGWEVVTLGDTCERITDGSHRSPETVNSGMPMASVKDMHNWGLNLSTCREISSEEYCDLVRNDCKVKAGDVLIAKDGATSLKTSFLVRKDLDVVLLSSVAILRPGPRLSAHLLDQMLKEPDVKHRLSGVITGAAIPRVVLRDFKTFKFVLPSRVQQRKWDAFRTPLAESIFTLVDKNNVLRQARDLLLPRLISGEIELPT